jgi:hypothetical protein
MNWLRPGQLRYIKVGRHMPRKRVNLRVFPAWLHYLIALTITAVVVAVAWLVGGGMPTLAPIG